MSSDDEEQTTSLLQPKEVELCPHCSFPFEFCEYSPKWETCAANLKKTDPDLLEKLRALRISSGREKPKPAPKPKAEGDEDGEAGVDTVDVDGDGDANEDDEDNEDEGDDEGEIAPVAAAKATKREIVIQTKDRTRRKHVTTVSGLESVGLKSKEIAKVFSKKFASSASVSAEVRATQQPLLSPQRQRCPTCSYLSIPDMIILRPRASESAHGHNLQYNVDFGENNKF